MSQTRNTALFATALAVATAAIAYDHAANGVPEPATVAAAAPAPGGTAPCAAGAPATAPCAAGAPAATTSQRALRPPPPPPAPLPEGATEAPDLVPASGS